MSILILLQIMVELNEQYIAERSWNDYEKNTGG